ncbi:MAG: HD domain-containing protein [Bacilli bacterium]|nr:HD domain-containing protein [Bacilli bacterium]
MELTSPFPSIDISSSSSLASLVVQSKAFRRMSGKTQLFSSYTNDHYHNRLTHTLEVFSVSLRMADILDSASKKSSDKKINRGYIEAISIAHDLGHTPFGHAGERCINEVLMGIDNLGGLIDTQFLEPLIFKHNFYSVKVLLGIVKNNDIDEKILTGIVLHTGLIPKDVDLKRFSDNLLSNSLNYYFANSRIKDCHSETDFGKNQSVEGKIVAEADEIAQRVSDLDDALQSKIIVADENFVKNALPDEQDVSVFFKEKKLLITRFLIEVSSVMIGGVSLKDGNVCLSESGKKTYDFIKKQINEKITHSYLIRSFDEKGRFFIRQLAKAFYKHPNQLEDETIEKIYADIRITLLSSSESKSEPLRKDPRFSCFLHRDDETFSVYEKSQILDSISELALRNEHSPEDEKSSSIKGKVFKIINTVFLRDIMLSIANMTDRYAVKKHHSLYESES